MSKFNFIYAEDLNLPILNNVLDGYSNEQPSFFNMPEYRIRR